MSRFLKKGDIFVENDVFCYEVLSVKDGTMTFRKYPKEEGREPFTMGSDVPIGGGLVLLSDLPVPTNPTLIKGQHKTETYFFPYIGSEYHFQIDWANLEDQLRDIAKTSFPDEAVELTFDFGYTFDGEYRVQRSGAKIELEDLDKPDFLQTVVELRRDYRMIPSESYTLSFTFSGLGRRWTPRNGDVPCASSKSTSETSSATPKASAGKSKRSSKKASSSKS